MCQFISQKWSDTDYVSGSGEDQLLGSGKSITVAAGDPRPALRELSERPTGPPVLESFSPSAMQRALAGVRTGRYEPAQLL